MHHNSITIENLNHTYPDGNHALKGINLKIKAGEQVALVGANGSGKSTLLLHLNGLFMPQKGSIVVGKYPMESKYLQDIRNFVGVVFQNPDDQLFMTTVGEDIAFGPMNQEIEGEELQKRCFRSMASVGLDLDRYWHRNANNLSGGEKKRVAIAGVLAMKPQIVVFDEPSAQLDPRSRRQFIDLLKDLPLTQLIATHDLDLALELCDRTVVLSEGRIVRDGITEEILSDRLFLEQHHLELPMSYTRPYCSLEDSPFIEDRRGRISYKS
jgi:cobalt/nickel transport system ATP-binding protein